VIFVYGVTPADYALPSGLRGVGDPPREPRLLAHGDLAAVVADLDEAPRRRQDLESHVAVMGELANAGTIVPMRFGTLMDDEDTVRRDLIDRHHQQLIAVLADLDGCVQMTLKAIYDEEVVLREAVQADPNLKRESDRLSARGDSPREAWIALGERVAAVLERTREIDERRIAELVDSVAEHVIVEAPGHDREVARLQILVRRNRRPRLDEAILGLQVEQEGRMTIRYSGPIAPYSFSDFSLEAAWA